jgi:hypothetical protein
VFTATLYSEDPLLNPNAVPTWTPLSYNLTSAEQAALAAARYGGLTDYYPGKADNHIAFFDLRLLEGQPEQRKLIADIDKPGGGVTSTVIATS